MTTLLRVFLHSHNQPARFTTMKTRRDRQHLPTKASYLGFTLQSKTKTTMKQNFIAMLRFSFQGRGISITITISSMVIWKRCIGASNRTCIAISAVMRQVASAAHVVEPTLLPLGCDSISRSVPAQLIVPVHHAIVCSSDKPRSIGT